MSIAQYTLILPGGAHHLLDVALDALRNEADAELHLATYPHRTVVLIETRTPEDADHVIEVVAHLQRQLGDQAELHFSDAYGQIVLQVQH